MAGKKNRNSQAPDAGDADGVPDVSGEGASSAPAAATADAPPVSTEPASLPASDEERIRQGAERTLEQKTGELSVKLAQAEARANGLEGELQRARAALATAEAQVVKLTSELAAATTAVKNAGTAIAGLPDNAKQLNECVTIASGTKGVGKGGRLHAKAGDVLIVTKDDDEVAELQRELGLRATVYKVDSATLEDLATSGFLHS